MEALAALLNLSGSIGVDADLANSAGWNRVAPPPLEEALWPLQTQGCIFDAAADEWVPARSPSPRRRRM
jgi:hypothetical protein